MSSAHISSVTQAGIRKEVRSSSVTIFADSLTRASHRKSSWDTLGRLVWGVGGPNAIAHWRVLFVYNVFFTSRDESNRVDPYRTESKGINGYRISEYQMDIRPVAAGPPHSLPVTRNRRESTDNSILIWLYTYMNYNYSNNRCQ